MGIIRKLKERGYVQWHRDKGFLCNFQVRSIFHKIEESRSERTTNKQMLIKREEKAKKKARGERKKEMLTFNYRIGRMQKNCESNQQDYLSPQVLHL